MKVNIVVYQDRRISLSPIALSTAAQRIPATKTPVPNPSPLPISAASAARYPSGSSEVEATAWSVNTSPPFPAPANDMPPMTAVTIPAQIKISAPSEIDFASRWRAIPMATAIVTSTTKTNVTTAFLISMICPTPTLTDAAGELKPAVRPPKCWRRPTAFGRASSAYSPAHSSFELSHKRSLFDGIYQVYASVGDTWK